MFIEDVIIFRKKLRLAALNEVNMERSLLLKKLTSFTLREFSTSSVCNGKKNFRQLALYNFRGSREFRKKRRQLSQEDPDIPYYTYGVREPGYYKDNKFHLVPEMIPEIIVPDLTGFNLKPYVSYKVPDVSQSKFTSKDLFDAVYSEKIKVDFNEGKLNEDGTPKEPNSFEKLTAEEALLEARKTGSDMF